MSYARAARRRAARGREPQEPPDQPHGGVFGTLDNGRAWSVLFPTTAEAERFLTLLGPPPATEDRLRAALRIMGKGLRDG
jgi:hypothetical protein